MKRLLIILLILPFFTFSQIKETPNWRPTKHFSPPKNWTNDPNGLIFFQGEYHLFYQHNPYENQWGHMSWGHAVSKDLLSWENLPLAIPEDSVWIFSGTVVADVQNTSGFSDQSEGCLVAIYTADYHGKKENQHLAYSNDKGRTWTKFAGNPILDLNKKDFRDPHIFWHKPTQQWIMSAVLPLEYKVVFFGSKNLKNWDRIGEFGQQGDMRKIWECPSLIELPVDGNSQNTKWLLMISSNGLADGFTGMQYFVGDFDGKNFTNNNLPETKLYVDFGKDYYAGIPFNNTPDNQKLMLGWLASWQYAGEIPTFPWKGSMSIPREISFKTFSEGIRLVQQPVEALKHKDENKIFEKENFVLSEEKQLNGNSLFAKNSYLIEVEFELKSAKKFGFKIGQKKDKADAKKVLQETIIGYDTKTQELYIDRTKSGKMIKDNFGSIEKVSLPLQDKKLKLQILVDKSSVEVFGNDGKVALTDLFFPEAGTNQFSIFTEKGKVTVTHLKIWDL
jgi:fructan beta-fructosidase